MPKSLKDYVREADKSSLETVDKFQSVIEHVAEKIATEVVDQAKEDLEDIAGDFKNDLQDELRKHEEYITSLVPEKGDKGERGENGSDGQDGYTPLKGIDYFDGKDGRNGVDGKDGRDGRDGKDAEVDLDKLKNELKSEIRFPSHGGNANFSVNINSSLASTRYADINFQQFGNIGWSATNDDVLKRVNIRASILVGGGGGAGTVRSTSVLSVSSTLAAASSTDYAFFVNDGILLTLPNAIGNTNRYSIKNMSTSSVLVSAATGQDIDGATTATLTRQYEAIDLMSNSSVWGVF